jgi:hypothetical protein
MNHNFYITLKETSNPAVTDIHKLKYTDDGRICFKTDHIRTWEDLIKGRNMTQFDSLGNLYRQLLPVTKQKI